MFHKV